MSKNFRVHLFLFLANLIYGVSFTIVKEVVPGHIRPFGAIVIRVGVSLLLFLLTHALFVREKVERRDLFLLLLCGLFGVAINQCLFFLGLSMTTPIHAALVMVTTPILVLVISALFQDEFFSWLKLLGVALGAAGAACIILSGKSFSFHNGQTMGDLWIFINASSYAIYLVIVKPLMKKYHPLTVIRWVFLFGMLFVLPVGWNQFASIHWGSFSPTIWWSLSFLVLGTTFLAYLFNILALRDAAPSIVGIYIYAQPVIATLFALILGKDKFSWVEALASLLIFTGVYLVSRKTEKA